MEEKNNFKKLEEEQELLFKEKMEKVKERIDSDLNSVRMVSDFFELYLSRVIDYFIKALGGKSDKK